MVNRFGNRASSIDGPATHGFAITPDDVAELGELTRAIFVGGSGALTVVLASGAEVSFAGLPSGALLPVRARIVKATGTTASALVGLV